jgi:hypothetical protein
VNIIKPGDCQGPKKDRSIVIGAVSHRARQAPWFSARGRRRKGGVWPVGKLYYMFNNNHLRIPEPGWNASERITWHASCLQFSPQFTKGRERIISKATAIKDENS